MVASHTETPLGVSKWLVKATPTHGTLPLGKGHGLTMSPTQGQAILLGGNLIPAIYFPSLREQWPLVRSPQGDNCMAGYLCLMPLASLFCNLTSQYYSIIQCPSYVGHYKYPCSIHPNYESGWTGICQINITFWAQKTGGLGHERVLRSKKRQFLRFLVTCWLTDGYTDSYL